jgi:hypothetical protein
MKAISAMLVALIITASQALAAGGAVQVEGLGVLAATFIGFGIMIVMFQFVPAALLVFGMLKGILSLGHKDAHAAAASK